MSVKNQEQSADQILQHYGYQPIFQRQLRRFASFAVGFSFISITTGIFSAYGTVLNSSGPLGIWTWPIVIIGQLFVALIFASLAARIPLAGYSYQWISRIANPKIGWLIGWVSFAFLTVVTVSVDYSIAAAILPRLLNYQESAGNVWLITSLVILLQALLIIFSTRWSTRINNLAVGTELAGVLGLTILLLIVGGIRGAIHPDHVFSTGVVPSHGYFGFGTLFAASPFFLAFLLGAYTITGFEAAANLTEETHDPHNIVPFAMWSAVGLSGIVGFIFLITLNLVSGNLQALTASPTPVADIVVNILGPAIGNILLIVVTFSIFACGLVILLTGTRLVWAMSRDERFPGYQLFRRVEKRTNTPVAATAFGALICEAVLAAFANQSNALANLFSAAALLPAIIYLSTVIFYIFVRAKLPQSKGFSLGRFEWPVIVLSIVWLLLELSIFRDAQFASPWIYSLVMIGLGILYFAWLLIARPHVLRIVPQETGGELEPSTGEQSEEEGEAAQSHQ